MESLAKNYYYTVQKNITQMCRKYLYSTVQVSPE